MGKLIVRAAFVVITALAVADAQPRRGGTLHVAQRAEPKTFNPVLALDAPSRDVLRRMHADLISIDRATQHTVPALAESWTRSNDGRVYTLRLRKGLRFSDGEAFSADDVVFSFGLYLDEKVQSPQRDLLMIGDRPIECRKVDPLTVEFHSPQPYAAAERMFDSVAILPKHLLESAWRDGKFADAWSLAARPARMAGLGPFRLKEYRQGERVVLERNPYYWKTGQPYLDEVEFRFLPDEDAQLARFSAGGIDILNRVNSKANEFLQANKAVLADLDPGLEYNFVCFNLSPNSLNLALFSNKEFRRALSLAADREAIARIVFKGRAAPIWGHVSPGNKLWYSSGIARPSRNVPAAREILRQAGLAGKPIKFSILVSATSAERIQMATILQADWGKAVAAVRADSPSRAFATKCDAHVAYIRGDHEVALAAYQEALRLFDESGDDLESARTLSSGLQTLILLGQYDQARSWAERAEKIFLKHGDALRLARLDSNVGNILFRQDRPREAIVHYERALEGFQNLGDGKDIAAVLSNLAVCQTALAHFAEAFSFYQNAREACVGNGLMALAAQADYNIAYLHYLRGDYRAAREIYQRCRLDGDAYHSALCDLDEAELLLELNLTHEGEVLAERAERGFAVLGMRYEQAKALVNRAVAASQRGDHELADQNLRKARRLFVRENNQTWRAMTDLLRAVLAFHANRHRSARALSSSAWRILDKTPVAARAAHCQILLARLWLQSGHADRARAIGHAAVERLGDDISPSLRFHASLLEGEVNEMQGRSREAIEAYEAARREIEDLRGRVDTEDLRISILKDKLAVYDALVSMCLDAPASRAAAERALLLVQQAKSRGLADRLSGTFETADPSEPYASLRKELNWCYRRIQTIGLERESGHFRDRARELEGQLLTLRAPARGPDPEPVSSVPAVQESLPEGALLLEYFEARGVLYEFYRAQRTGGGASGALRPNAATDEAAAISARQIAHGNLRAGHGSHQSPSR